MTANPFSPTTQNDYYVSTFSALSDATCLLSDAIATEAINYSPKHRKSQSTPSRKINMKNLSLNLAPDVAGVQISPRNTAEQSTLLTKSEPNAPPARRQTLTLSIPSLPLQTSPKRNNAPSLLRSNTDIAVGHTKTSLASALSSPFSAQIDSLSSQINEVSINEEPEPLNIDVRLLLSRSGETVSSIQHQFPEELQELNLLDAYTNGPANVLNNCIFLYSDPVNSPRQIDINDYDLVINVARECADMSLEHLPQPGKRYMYVPWSHTSAILKELPTIIDAISDFDDSDKPLLQPKRKILVHCQCGVSRSACVIVAYFMFKFGISVNQAYDLLKLGSAPQIPSKITGLKSPFVAAKSYESVPSAYTIDACSLICPNMRLIFELMEFGDSLS